MLEISPIHVWTVLFGYLLGSIPFGLLLTRMAGFGDIRDIGSGNIGATNVLRTGNKGLALATLILDAGKGAAAVLLAQYIWGDNMGPVAGVAAFIGHTYPVWLRFKGGKGVATFIGIGIAIHPILGLAVCGTWLMIAFLMRYSSLAALIAAGMAPVYTASFAPADKNTLWLITLMTLLIYMKHETNIHRLLNGTEPKIGKSKPITEDAA